MRKTNFDQSSSGLNLELICFRDTDRSRDDFEESFTRVSDQLWIFTEFGNVSDDFSLSDAANYQFTVEEFKQAFIHSYDAELSRYYMSKPFSKLTKAELIELLECQAYDSEEIADFYQSNFKPLFDKITTRGYCQGHYAEVIITPAFHKFLADNGTTFEKSKCSLKKEIDRLFWDCQVYCVLTINGGEYCLSDVMNDCYEYDKDQLIVDFMSSDQLSDFTEEQQELIARFLAKNLPDSPDYD